MLRSFGVLTEEGAIMDEKQVLLELSKIELEYAKHHDNQRERMTSLILIFAGFCIASVGWDRQIGDSDAWIGGFLALVGMFGVIFSLKHYENFKLHYSRFREYRAELDKKFENSPIMNLKNQGDCQHTRNMRYPFTKRIPLHRLWASLPALIAIIGCAIVLIAAL